MQDKSLTDIIKFLDPTGNITDAAASEISKQLTFTDVLDIVGMIKDNKLDDAREVLLQYDDRFGNTESNQPQQTSEGSNLPMTKPVAKTPMAVGGSQSTVDNSNDEDVDQLLADPRTKNSPEVRQINQLLNKLKNR